MRISDLWKIGAGIVVLSLLLLLPAVVLGQNGGRVYLSSVVGTFDSSIAVGFPATFTFNFHNLDPANSVEGFTNGFKLSGTNDLQWTCDYAFHPTFPTDEFDLYTGLAEFNWDGTGSDTLGLMGARLWQNGLPGGFNGPALVLTVAVNFVAYVGEQFCIDSTYFRPSETWMWAYASAVGSFAPEWDGPHCYTILELPCKGCCCRDLTGNINDDAGDNVDISDLTKLVNHLFVTFESLNCPAEANVNGDAACNVDISDLTKLVNHLFVTFESPAVCNYGCTKR